MSRPGEPAAVASYRFPEASKSMPLAEAVFVVMTDPPGTTPGPDIWQEGHDLNVLDVRKARAVNSKSSVSVKPGTPAIGQPELPGEFCSD